MMRVPWKVQLGLIGFCYAMVVGLSAILIFVRYLQYIRHPDDVATSSGMWAGGDLILELFICCMLMAVTFLLVLVIRKSETAYTIYSKVVLAISLSAPVSLGVMAIPAVGGGNSLVGWACMFRAFASPVVLAGLGMSRIFARFSRAKRITNWALLIEALTLAFMFLMLFLPAQFLHS